MNRELSIVALVISASSDLLNDIDRDKLVARIISRLQIVNVPFDAEIFRIACGVTADWRDI